jgi:parvulin-like peptidyl-prolyl isomerase
MRSQSLFLLMVAACTVWMACGSEANGDVPVTKTPDPPILTINNHTYTQQDYQAALFERYGAAHLETFLEDELIKKHATALGVSVPEAEINKLVEQEVDKLRSSRFGGNEIAFQNALRENGTSLQGWRRELYTRTWRKLMLDELIKKSRTADSASVKRKFEQEYGEEGLKLRLRHILVSSKVLNTQLYPREEYQADLPRVEQELKTLGQELLVKLRDNGDFEALALQHSDDFTATKGGLLGTSWKGRFGDAFDQAIEKLGPGQTSGLIQSNRGFHIAEVTEITKGVEFQGSAILINAGPSGPTDNRTDQERQQAAQTRLEEIQKELAAGKPFADVAKRLSDDVATKGRGGDLGTFGRRRLGDEVAVALETMEPGSVSAPINTPRGYWIIKLDKRTFVAAADQRVVRHILLSTAYDDVKRRRLEDKLPQMARTRAEELLAELNKGADFADLAARHSEDAYTRKAGGEYYNYRSGSLGTEIWDAAKTLQPNKLTIVESPRGFHIVEIIERTQTSFDDVKDTLLKDMAQQPSSPADARVLLDSLKENAQIACPGPWKDSPSCNPAPPAAPASAPASAPAPAPTPNP